VPVYHSKTGPFCGESLIKGSARYAQLLTNWLSSLDSTLERQSFSQACLVSDMKPSEVGVGSSTVLHLRPGRKEGDLTVNAEDYFFRSPDSAPVTVLLESFKFAFMLAGLVTNCPFTGTCDRTWETCGAHDSFGWVSIYSVSQKPGRVTTLNVRDSRNKTNTSGVPERMTVAAAVLLAILR
jgi:hypothetical protein